MKGFFTIILVIAMSVVLLELAIITTNNSFGYEKTKTQLIEIEQANKERTLLENNCDRIIETTIEKQIMIQNHDPIVVQTQINLALLNYLQNKANASNIFYENKGPLTIIFLNTTTTAFIYQANGLTYAEWAYTSDITKTFLVTSKLGRDADVYFIIPIGYTKRIVR